MSQDSRTPQETITKVCNTCKESKSLNRFKRFNQCIDCYNTYQRNYKRRNAEKCREFALNSIRKSKYGMTKEEYDVLFKLQSGLCAICFKPQEGKRLAVDHNHITNENRGLLCEKCNRGLGLFKDNIELLSNAISYLESRGSYG